MALKTVKNCIFTIFGIMTTTKEVYYYHDLTRFRGFAQGQHFYQKVFYFSKVDFIRAKNEIYRILYMIFIRKPRSKAIQNMSKNILNFDNKCLGPN